MKKLHEMKYSDIFKDPATMSGVERRNAETRARLLDNDSLMKIMQKSQVLLSQLKSAEAPYKTQLEELAVEMVKKMYPIIDEYNIEIEATLGQNQLPPQENEDDEEETSMPSEDQPDLKNDEVAKRRLINAITQGASIYGSLDKPFIDFLDDVDDNLLQRYSAVVTNLNDSISKYGDTLKKVFGIFYDKEAIAMLLAMLAGNPEGANGKGGESDVSFDNEGNLKIRATGSIFPFLVHEIIKGLYEIVSLQGFTKDVSTNQAITTAADKLEHEPEDFGTGTHILSDLRALYNNANVRNKIPFELFLANIYREDDAKAFVEFIENLLNNRVTSSQKRWAEDHMEPTPDVEDEDDDIDNINLPDFGLNESKPYKNIEITENYIIREFDENIDPIKLKWHRNKEDRIIEIVGKTDWKLQLENQLPTSINQPVRIPKGEWHRVIKGTGKLTLKIIKEESTQYKFAGVLITNTSTENGRPQKDILSDIRAIEGITIVTSKDYDLSGETNAFNNPDYYSIIKVKVDPNPYPTGFTSEDLQNMLKDIRGIKGVKNFKLNQAVEKTTV